VECSGAEEKIKNGAEVGRIIKELADRFEKNYPFK
jgi:hypothetical protein